MKLLTTVFVLFMAVASVAQTQGAAAKPKPVSPYAEYAGEWTSSLQGKIWLRLQLSLNGEQLTGWLQRASHVEFSDGGEVKSVGEEQQTDTLASAVVNPDGLLLTVQDSATQQSERYLMRLVIPEKTTAELKVIGMAMPPGMPKPRPWRLVRMAAPATSGTTQPK